jgi:hypothetical protein
MCACRGWLDSTQGASGSSPNRHTRLPRGARARSGPGSTRC